MANKVVILQPSYIPWLGHFNMMMNVDTFVYFDNVQYTRRDWRNRNYFLNLKGEKKLLTIPIQSKGNYKQLINEISINYQQNKWIKQHLWLIKESYRKEKYFEEVFLLLSNCLKSEFGNLSALNVEICQSIADYLEIKTKILKSSNLQYEPYSNATEHLVNICKSLNASHYLSGPASKAYMNETSFKENNIELVYHNYNHPIYKQNNSNFIPYLSILDVLFRYGKASKEIIFQPQF